MTAHDLTRRADRHDAAVMDDTPKDGPSRGPDCRTQPAALGGPAVKPTRRSAGDIARNCADLARRLATRRQAEADQAKTFAESVATAANVRPRSGAKAWMKMEKLLRSAVAELGGGDDWLDTL